MDDGGGGVFERIDEDGGIGEVDRDGGALHILLGNCPAVEGGGVLNWVLLAPLLCLGRGGLLEGRDVTGEAHPAGGAVPTPLGVNVLLIELIEATEATEAPFGNPTKSGDDTLFLGALPFQSPFFGGLEEKKGAGGGSVDCAVWDCAIVVG
jgi:hypothetical protein